MFNIKIKDIPVTLIFFVVGVLFLFPFLLDPDMFILNSELTQGLMYVLGSVMIIIVIYSYTQFKSERIQKLVSIGFTIGLISLYIGFSFYKWIISQPWYIRLIIGSILFFTIISIIRLLIIIYLAES